MRKGEGGGGDDRPNGLPPGRHITREQMEAILGGRKAFLEKQARYAIPITRVFPQPVRLELGGRERYVSELRLRDIAYLQARIAEWAADPLADLPPKQLDDAPETRPERLQAAWRAVRRWPPLFGSDEARPWLYGAEGRAGVLWCCLRREVPRPLPAECHAIAASMDGLEWTRFYRVAYAVDLWREPGGELGLTDDEDAPQVSWVESIVELIWGDEHRKPLGWDFDTLGNLTLSQWRALRGGEDAFRHRPKARPGESMEDARNRFKGLIGGED